MYDEKTSIYMLSDGYFDQFGGIEDTKFNSKRFKKLLIDNRHLPMIEQKEVIRQTLADWKGDREQVDDILVLGVKLD
jgi:serine phosphatase RsbU (regulator of sigma subunit)